MLGHKGFARYDEEGFVDKIPTTPAHVGASPQFKTMIEGSNAQRVFADKAYASIANRYALKGKHRDSILHKAVRGRPLR
jgi:IS5 family transposase